MTCEWYYNPLKGQPRHVDIDELRRRAKDAEVTLQINAVIDAVLAKGYKISGKKAQQFFMNRDFHCELRQFLKDLLEVDAGVFVKGFDAHSYTQTKASGFVLNPRGKRHLVELTARDGASFLREVDVNGFVFRYWQYSYLHEHLAPLEFDVDEVAYAQLHPRSDSVYGCSPLETDYPHGFWARVRGKIKPYKLTLDSVRETQKCVENTINRDIMSELGNGKFQIVK